MQASHENFRAENAGKICAEKTGLGSAPWFGNIAIMCGGGCVALLLALGVWTDGGMGELTGGLRSNTLSGSSAIVAPETARPKLDLALHKNTH